VFQKTRFNLRQNTNNNATQTDWIDDRAKRVESSSCKISLHLQISAPSSWRNGAVQIIAVQNVVDWPRAVVQLRYPKILLSYLVQASRRQRPKDTAHLSPQCTPRRRAGENKQLSITAQLTSRKKRGGYGCLRVCFLDVSRFLIGEMAAHSWPFGL